MDELERQPEEEQPEKTEEKRSEPKRRKRHKKRRVSGTAALTLMISVAVMLAFCLVMSSPLGSCTMTDADYIGKAAAQKVAFNDAGIGTEGAKSVGTDMIKLDDAMCYKVDFSTDEVDYSYIINAESGKIVVSRSEEHQSDK